MKLVRPQAHELEALASVDGRDWELIDEWLERSREDLVNSLRDSVDDRQVRQVQGALQLLDEFLEAKRGARETIRSLKSR